MKKLKFLIGSLSIIALFAITIGGIYWWIFNYPDTAPIPQSYRARLYWHQKVNPWDLQQVQSYCQKFGYNDSYYIICDFGRASGKKRFYLYDLNDKERMMSSYCMHGNGSGSTAEKPVFSNLPGSNCSSIGLYALKGTGSRKFRNCIQLTGLDNTNSMARARGLLIHSSGKTSRFHGETQYIPLGNESHGCFTIARADLQQLMQVYTLHGKRKRILMWACA